VIVLTRELGQSLVVGDMEIVFVEDDCNGDGAIRLGIRRTEPRPDLAPAPANNHNQEPNPCQT
jgi:hypothetical protein